MVKLMRRRHMFFVIDRFMNQIGTRGGRELQTHRGCTSVIF